jgi:hypothetical protein
LSPCIQTHSFITEENILGGKISRSRGKIYRLKRGNILEKIRKEILFGKELGTLKMMTNGWE